MSTVRLNNLSVKLGGNNIIKGLDLAVEEGEFLVLLGPSGCGKSTLLHAIAGLVDTEDGSVHIGGTDMTFTDPSRRDIGMVFQSYALYPTMTVRNNMSFGLRVKGMPKAEIERRVQAAAAMLQLEQLLDRKPAQLSGGQRQRVAIGRALVREAGVFLFDEPLSNLDAKLRTELRHELKQLHQALRSTMIYVTHDQVEAMTLATRIAVMRNGSVQQIGTPAQVYERPVNLFVAGFLGSPSMNFVEGKLRADGMFGTFEFGGCRLAVSGYAYASQVAGERNAVLGVRAEHICIEPGAPCSGRVSLVEPMGSHQIVWIESSGLQLSAIVRDARAFAIGETVDFAIDCGHISLFDRDSEERL